MFTYLLTYLDLNGISTYTSVDFESLTTPLVSDLVRPESAVVVEIMGNYNHHYHYHFLKYSK